MKCSLWLHKVSCCAPQISSSWFSKSPQKLDTQVQVRSASLLLQRVATIRLLLPQGGQHQIRLYQNNTALGWLSSDIRLIIIALGWLSSDQIELDYYCPRVAAIRLDRIRLLPGVSKNKGNWQISKQQNLKISKFPIQRKDHMTNFKVGLSKKFFYA